MTTSIKYAYTSIDIKCETCKIDKYWEQSLIKMFINGVNIYIFSSA